MIEIIMKLKNDLKQWNSKLLSDDVGKNQSWDIIVSLHHREF